MINDPLSLVPDGIEGPRTLSKAPDGKPEGLIALTTDAALVETLQAAASPHETRAVSRETDLVRSLLASPAAAVIIDTAALSRFPVQQVTERLKEIFPRLAIVVMGTAPDQAALSLQLAAGTVRRFLLKPVPPSRVSDVIETVLWPPPEESAAGGARRWPVWAWWTGATLLVALTAAGAYMQRQRVAAVWAAAWAAPAPAQEPLPELLARADEALTVGAYDEAAHLYSKALAASPGNPRASGGLTAVARRLVVDAQMELLERRVPLALKHAQQAAALAPTLPELPPLNAQIRAAQADNSAPVPQTTAARAGAHTPAGAPADLDEQLHHAQELMRKGRLIEPAEDNARDALRLARKTAPGDSRVGRQQRQLLSLLVAQARTRLAAGRPEEATPLIAAASEMGARPDEIEELTHQASQDPVTVRSNELASLATAFNERLRQGQILEPADGSAKFYLGELARHDPDGPATQLARAALARRMLREAGSAVRQQDLPAARRWLAEARETGAEPASLTALEDDIAAADSLRRAAGAGISGEDQSPPGLHLQKIHDADAAYPAAARQRRLVGQVELAFTINADGSTGGYVVISAEPAGVFEQAAIDAVRHWRYQPPQHTDGAPAQPVRTSTIFRFAP